MEIGVIGVGNWGSKVVEEYLKLGLKPAICDIDAERLNFIKNKYEIENAVEDYKKLLSDSKIDAVNICTPNETHHEICVEALKACKHVLLEKPMTLNSRKAEELVKISKRNNTVLMVGHIYHYNQAMLELRKMVREGFFGKIIYIDYFWTDLIEPKSDDIIFDLGCHAIDILHFLFEEYPKEVACMSPFTNKLKTTFIFLQFNNFICNIELSWLSPIKKREILIFGEDRSAKIECVNQRIFVYNNRNIQELKIVRNNTLNQELTHFLDCITNNKKPETDGESGKKIVKVLEFVKKSLKEKKRVDVKI